MTPNTINIGFDIGEDFSESFRFASDCDGEVLIDLTSYSFDADMKAGESQAAVATFTFDTTDAAEGLIHMQLAASVTQSLQPMTYRYDILVTDPNGGRSFWVRGDCVVSRPVTRRAV